MVANIQADIWSRVIDVEKANLPRDVAKAFLSLRFSDLDRKRMKQLAVRARSGRLTDSQKVELQEYLRTGDLLTLMKIKARQSLQKPDAPGPAKATRARATRAKNGAVSKARA